MIDFTFGAGLGAKGDLVAHTDAAYQSAMDSHNDTEARDRSYVNIPKKTNFITNPNNSGNVNGGFKRPTIYNPNEHPTTTNRENLSIVSSPLHDPTTHISSGTGYTFQRCS